LTVEARLGDAKKEQFMAHNTSSNDILELASELTIAWLSNPNTKVSAEEIPFFLEKMHVAVAGLATSSTQAKESASANEYTPAVSVRRSLASRDHLISMIDGKPYKTLKRHLAGHGLTPAQYRERYGLKADYPMVAESYAELRRGLAKKIGLGRKPGVKVPAAQRAAPTKTTRGARTAKAAQAGAVAQP
jgi:predicted transcriptional regulator